MTFIGRVHLHWVRGKHNEIPRCCRVWFLIRYYSGWSSIIGIPWVRWFWQLKNDLLPWEVNYVRCPICFKKKRNVKVHRCTIECEGKPGATVRFHKPGES